MSSPNFASPLSHRPSFLPHHSAPQRLRLQARKKPAPASGGFRKKNGASAEKHQRPVCASCRAQEGSRFWRGAPAIWVVGVTVCFSAPPLQILVWHTRTEKPILVNEGKKGFTDPNVEI